jgi:hypothetical protein
MAQPKWRPRQSERLMLPHETVRIRRGKICYTVAVSLLAALMVLMGIAKIPLPFGISNMINVWILPTGLGIVCIVAIVGRLLRQRF